MEAQEGEGEGEGVDGGEEERGGGRERSNTFIETALQERDQVHVYTSTLMISLVIVHVYI